ncbi:MAG: PP2C family protein-serine/threonine phosphatase [Phycisphaerales bacterium]
MPPSESPTPAATMQCLEVWGGNQATDNAVALPGLDAWVYARPHENALAGGDIHYLSSCATGRIVRILVADVSGHGITVAQIATKLRSLMRRYVNYVDQTRLVSGINAEFTRLAELEGFATAVVATYWTPTDEIVISNAGHPPPLVYRARQRAWDVARPRSEPTAASTPGEPSNIPLGIAEQTGYDQFPVRLAHGDLLLLYTDSLIEAREPDGRLLGVAGLIKRLNALDPAAPERLIPALLASLGGEDTLQDDATALLLRPNDLKPRGSLAVGLLAGWRIARESIRGLGRLPLPRPQLGARNIAGAFLDRLNRIWQP